MTPIELTAGGARMRLYPNTDLLVDVPREVALHLFSLVCRYNVARGRSWNRFWRGLKQIERDMTVLFVEANGKWEDPLPAEAMLGTTLWYSGLAEDFRAVAHSGRRQPLTVAVKNELVSLSEIYTRATVSKEALASAWKESYPGISTLLQEHGVWAPLFDEDRCFETGHVIAVVEAVLLAHGHDVVQQIEGWSHLDRCRNDAVIFASCVRQLLP
ncbi:hypothetical protein [Cupriavidus sp. TMH.W2]|uniref:hypothetical protein n=1 Tax=Cupriavidus sp. TMH.W2 TaxID=3434465 RepID=UPI003D76C3D0